MRPMTAAPAVVDPAWIRSSGRPPARVRASAAAAPKGLARRCFADRLRRRRRRLFRAPLRRTTRRGCSRRSRRASRAERRRRAGGWRWRRPSRRSSRGSSCRRRWRRRRRLPNSDTRNWPGPSAPAEFWVPGATPGSGERAEVGLDVVDRGDDREAAGAELVLGRGPLEPGHVVGRHSVGGALGQGAALRPTSRARRRGGEEADDEDQAEQRRRCANAELGAEATAGEAGPDAEGALSPARGAHCPGRLARQTPCRSSKTKENCSSRRTTKRGAADQRTRRLAGKRCEGEASEPRRRGRPRRLAAAVSAASRRSSAVAVWRSARRTAVIGLADLIAKEGGEEALRPPAQSDGRGPGGQASRCWHAVGPRLSRGAVAFAVGRTGGQQAPAPKTQAQNSARRQRCAVAGT